MGQLSTQGHAGARCLRLQKRGAALRTALDGRWGLGVYMGSARAMPSAAFRARLRSCDFASCRTTGDVFDRSTALVLCAEGDPPRRHGRERPTRRANGDVQSLTKAADGVFIVRAALEVRAAATARMWARPTVLLAGSARFTPRRMGLAPTNRRPLLLVLVPLFAGLGSGAQQIGRLLEI